MVMRAQNMFKLDRLLRFPGAPIGASLAMCQFLLSCRVLH
jgi:hypothetical protein